MIFVFIAISISNTAVITTFANGLISIAGKELIGVTVDACRTARRAISQNELACRIVTNEEGFNEENYNVLRNKRKEVTVSIS